MVGNPLDPLVLIGGVLLSLVTGLIGHYRRALSGSGVIGAFIRDGCNMETERWLHRCGVEARLIHGWRWLSNDAVNAIASVVGVGVAVGTGWGILRGGMV